MQIRMLFLVLFSISSDSRGMLPGDSQTTSSVKEVVAMPAEKKPRLEDPTPPDCFRIIDDATSRSVHCIEEQNQFDVLDRVSSFESFSSWMDSLMFESDYNDQLTLVPPPLPSLYYLMFHDYSRNQVRTLFAYTKNELLKMYVVCYINEANTATSRHAQAHLHAKVPYMPITGQELNFSITCNAGSGLCKHVEKCGSRELLMVHLFAHFVIEHCRSSKWVVSIEKAISNSYQEAEEKLYGAQIN